MIIDTSALVAVLNEEIGSDALFEALSDGGGQIPTPVLVEYERVTALTGNRPDSKAKALLDTLLVYTSVVVFDSASADAAMAANACYGRGSGHRAKLNMLDLMVYGIAKVAGLPILCTGKDFASTDAMLHPASRRG